MNYVAFDLGTRCGVAYGEADAAGFHAIDLRGETGRFGDDAFFRFRKEAKRVLEDMSRFDGCEVFIEKPHAGQFFHATRILFGLMGVLESVCQELSINYTYYSPASVKKFWTGNGHAKKPEMMLRTKNMGYETKDHNVSDAIALLHYGWYNA